MVKEQANWSPYDNNGGTVVAIAGADYCVIASDTRMSTGYSILTRDYSKICKLADKSVMASSGFQADVRALQKVLAARHLIHFDEGLSARSRAGDSTKLVTKGIRGKSASEKLSEEGLVKFSARLAIQVDVVKSFDDTDGPQWKHSIWKSK